MNCSRRWFLTLLATLPAWGAPEQHVRKIFKAWKDGPGGSVGVVHKGRLIFAQGFGLADISTKLPNTPQTNFDLASLSKQFTATTILLADQEGKLALSDPISRFLPGLPPYAASVRVEQLLGMLSGLPEYDDTQPASLKDLIATLQAEGPTFRAGERYEYLNMNYALLTFIAAKVHGKSLGAVLRERVFAPLAMNRTTFLETSGQKVAQRAVGYREKSGRPVKSRNDVPGIGDGNVFSNVEDLSRWCIDLLAGSRILKSKWQKLAWTSGRLSNGKKTEYGCGFEVDTHAGQVRISHTGSWAGTSTYLGLYPGSQLGVIVLSNWEDEEVLDMGEQLAKVYL